MIGIYKITNKINGKVYIGQSIHIEKRWKEHIFDNRKNSLIHLAIIKYGKENFSFEVIEECNQKELNQKEQYWIKKYNSFENGYNLTRGGSQGFYYDIESIYENYLQTQNINQTAKNVGCHCSTVRNIIRMYGINHSEMQQEKPVEKIDCQTLQTIQIYDSIQSAASDMKVSRDAISSAATGHKKSSCGYYWRFVGDSEKNFEIKPVKKWKRKINQLDLKNNFIQQFDSAADAARSLGKDGKNGGSQIISVCKGKKKTIYGFKWEYAD